MDNERVCTYIRRHVGETVETLCLEHGLSQATLASMVGIDRSHLNQFIKGHHNVSLDLLVKIADGLDVPLTELFAGLEHLPPYRLVTEYDGRGAGTRAGQAGGRPAGR